MERPPDYIYLTSNDRSWCNWIFFYVYRFFRMLIVSFYFYFMPFASLYLAFGWPGDIFAEPEMTESANSIADV